MEQHIVGLSTLEVTRPYIPDMINNYPLEEFQLHGVSNASRAAFGTTVIIIGNKIKTNKMFTCGF